MGHIFIEDDVLQPLTLQRELPLVTFSYEVTQTKKIQ